MSDNVDNVLNSVSGAAASEATEPADVVVEEAPVVSASEAVEVDETVEPVASASEAEEAPVEEEPVVQPQPEPEPEPVVEPEPAPVSTQEVVQNVQEILSSTETNVSVDNSESNDLENRVKVLEERFEKLIKVLRDSWICDKINNKGSKSELYNTLIL